MFDNTLEVLVVPNQFESCLWADAFDWVEIVATKEDAEINEL
jgi:hypothetical protein